MRDLYDTLFSPDRFGRVNKWDVEPDFDEIASEFDGEDDEPIDDEDVSLDEWLDANGE